MNVLPVVVLLIRPLWSSFGQYLQFWLWQTLEGLIPPLGLGSVGGYVSLERTNRSLRFVGLLWPKTVVLS